MRGFALVAGVAVSFAMLFSIALAAPVPAKAPASVKAPAPVKTLNADVIVTAASEYRPLVALDGGERFPKGAALELIHEGKAEKLAKDFAASADAQVSFDGKRVLFAGKKTEHDPWQIWEMKLDDRSVRLVIGGAADAIRPFYLPAGRLVFARKGAAGFEIVAAGTATVRALAPLDEKAAASEVVLTHLPGSAIPDDVLADGRILFESKYPLGAGKTAELFLMYSDGSGVESYRCDHGRARWGGRELRSGDVVFTHGASLARFTSPLAHEAAIVAQHLGGALHRPRCRWFMPRAVRRLCSR